MSEGTEKQFFTEGLASSAEKCEKFFEQKVMLDLNPTRNCVCNRIEQTCETCQIDLSSCKIDETVKLDSPESNPHPTCERNILPLTTASKSENSDISFESIKSSGSSSESDASGSSANSCIASDLNEISSVAPTPRRPLWRRQDAFDMEDEDLFEGYLTVKDLNNNDINM